MTMIGALNKGFEYIISCQNTDGGIGADKLGDPSGLLTTGICLETCAGSPFFPAKFTPNLLRMVDYLLARQGDDGSWQQLDETQLLDTAYAVAGLNRAANIFKDNSARYEVIQRAIQSGIAWISTRQNPVDGGWALDPVSGTPDATSTSRIVTTTGCLDVYYFLGAGYSDSDTANRALIFLAGSQNGDSGWGQYSGKESDVGSTARVINTLLLSGKYISHSPIIRDGIGYLKRHRDKRATWDLVLEVFYNERAFWGNTPIDAIRALVRAGAKGRQLDPSIVWLLNSQDPRDGHWPLIGSNQKISGITTWTTRDALVTLSLAFERELNTSITSIASTTRHKIWRVVAIALFVTTLAETLYIAGIYQLIAQWWQSLPGSTQSSIVNFVVFVVIVGSVLGLAVNFIYDLLRRAVTKNNH